LAAVLAGLLGGRGLRQANAESQAPPKSVEGLRGSAAVEPAAKGGVVPTTNLFDIMREGGVLMWPLALCSLVGVALVFERLVSLRRSGVIPKSFVRRFLEQVRNGELDRAQALSVCQERTSPIARIFAAAARKWGRPGVEVEQAILDAGERATNGLRRYLRVFTALTVIAPLLGLLGTVFGMIRAFNAVASTDALGRPELLAQGISQALLNTAFGLAVAIPAQSFYFYFVSRVDRLIIEMDGLGQELVNLISAEELEHRDEAARGSKPRRPRREAA
jgi:biopolymer transport protein ExbB